LLSANQDVVVTGLAGTGAIGTETIKMSSSTGVAGTGAVGMKSLRQKYLKLAWLARVRMGTAVVSDSEDVVVTGVSGTGAYRHGNSYLPTKKWLSLVYLARAL
jgi:hypothetical protein